MKLSAFACSGLHQLCDGLMHLDIENLIDTEHSHSSNEQGKTFDTDEDLSVIEASHSCSLVLY